MLSRYYESKVQAAIAALTYKESKKPEDRAAAEKLADEAVEKFMEAADYMEANLSPILQELYGTVMRDINNGPTLLELVQAEKAEWKELARYFEWPEE